jgi:predicted MFS family arabinose efflux permease
VAPDSVVATGVPAVVTAVDYTDTLLAGNDSTDTPLAYGDRTDIPLAGDDQAAVAHLSPRQRLLRGLGSLFERSALLPGVIVLFSNMVLGAVSTFMALTGYARGVDNIAFYFVCFAVAVMLSRPFFGRMVDKSGYTVPIVFGLLSNAAAMLIAAQADSLLLFLVAGMFFGLGQGSVLATLQTMAVANAPRRRHGAATSTFFVFFDTGIGIGAMAGGHVVDALGYSGMYSSFAVLPLLALAIYMIFGRRRSRQE